MQHINIKAMVYFPVTSLKTLKIRDKSAVFEEVYGFIATVLLEAV